jgi:hypothetical protein
LNIDNSSYETLEIIYQNSRITKDQLKHKFPRKPEGGLNSDISVLFANQFVENPAVGVDKDYNVIYDCNVFDITQKGKEYYEARARDHRRWITPIIISTIAIVFSGLALAKSFGLLELLLKLLRQ